MKILQQELEKERQSKTKEKQSEYCARIKEQIRIKEQERKNIQQQSQQQLEDTRLQEQQRQERIGEIISNKLKDLQISRGVPENLIKDVERRIKRVV